MEFAVGDRVKLRADGAENWLDPKLRRRARLGRAATVTSITGTGLPPARRSYRINFDCVGREKPLSETIPVAELEFV